MTVNGQAGDWGFAPQIGLKNYTGLLWRAHRALFVDAGLQDDSRLGPPEVGGIPAPSSAYKNGYFVTGGVTVNPRLEDTLGWLLYATLGDVETIADDIDVDAVHGPYRLSAAPVTGYSDNITALYAPTALVVAVYETGNATFSGDVIVYGVDANGDAVDETYTLAAVAPGAYVTAAQEFVKITAIDWPAYTTDGDVLSIGLAGAVGTHIFKLNSLNYGHVPYIAMRKRIPPEGFDLDTDLGEIYYDNKILNFGFTFPNDGLITARIDALGRDYAFDDASSDWTWTAEYEDSETVPVSCAEGSYLRAFRNSANFPTDQMAVLNAVATIANTPAPMTELKVYGDPRLHDITVTNRQVDFQITALYDNPRFYRAVTTGSPLGSQWTHRPFMCELDIKAIGGDVMEGTAHPYSLHLKAPRVNLRLTNPIALAPGRSVLLNFEGTALVPSEGEYIEAILRNEVVSYDWPGLDLS
jgi:hypothetical protein